MSFSSDSESDQGLPTSMTIQLNSRPTELLLSKRNTNGSVTVVRDDRDDSPLHQFQQLLPLSPSVELHSSISEEQGELPDSCEDDSDSSSQEGSDAEETLPLPPAAVVAEVVAPISVSVPPVPSDLPPSISRLSPATGNSGAEDVPAEDRPSHVSLLGGKYLLFSNPTNAPQQQQTPCQTKNVLKCINVETRQHYFCKVVPRSATGLSLLAAYHRLDDFSDCINKIHEIILAPKLIYLIFPLNYGNVHSYLLAKKRLREGEAVHLFKQMVTAVQYCHDKGIVLRDLKLGKFVFLDRERTIIKLESLEDAVLLSDDSDDGLSDKHGCPNYVSPEKAEILRTNNKYPGKATDIWGLGVMLYTMLVGRYPFNDADHAKLFSKIRRGNFTIPEPLSTNSKCLIRCLLRKDPTGRLNCTEILRHPWILEERQQGRTSLPCTARDSQNRSGLGSRGNTMSRGNSNNNAISALPVFVTGSSRMPSHQMSMSGQSRGDAHHQMEEDQVVPVFNPSS